MQPAGWIHIVPLDSRKETTLSIPFTFLSVDWRRNTADISKVYVYFGNQWISLEDVIPIESSVEITNLRIRWEDDQVGKILALRIGYGLKFGGEVTLRKDRTGFVDKIDVALSTRASEDTLKSIDARLAQPTTLSSLTFSVDNSTGSVEITQALVASSTPSKRARIKRDANDTGICKINDYPIDPGEAVETTIDDLSKITVKVGAGAVCNLYVLYEK